MVRSIMWRCQNSIPKIQVTTSACRCRGVKSIAIRQKHWIIRNATIAVVATLWLAAMLLMGTDVIIKDVTPIGRMPYSTLGGKFAVVNSTLQQPAAEQQQQQQRQQQQQQQQHAPASRVHAAPAPVTPEALQRGKQLHGQTAFAVRSDLGSYPEIHWTHYSGRQLQSPSEADLQRSSSGRANASNPYMLVAYNGTFFGKRWPTHALQCTVPCAVTSDVAKYGQRADVLVYHAPELDWDRFWAAHKPQHQLWALHSMESQEAYTVQQAAAPSWQRLDIQATYKLSAVRPGLVHVAVPYLNSRQYGGFTTKRPAMYDKTALVLWMHDNCDAVSYRQQLVQQLMQLMPVDAPGACLRNMDAGGLNTAAPTELMAQYKFYLVFENVFGDPDWVSSTFFRALDAGTVPVVLGAPNVLKFAPGLRSIIRACDFDSQQELADYLMYLNSNDTAYREYLSWKEAGPTAEFSSLMRTADLSPWCEMCIAAAQRTPWAFDNATQQELAVHRQTNKAFGLLNAQLDRDASVPCRGKTAWWEVQPAAGDAALWARDEALEAPLG